MKTFTPKQTIATDRKWYIIDAKGETLWKIASKIAVILKGKNKVAFAPHLDNGDYVIVINCDKFVVTGKKLSDKMYRTHSWFLGGLKEVPLSKLLVKKPTRPLELAVVWMLPKNKLKSAMISRLKLFTGEEHTYVAQKPELIK